MKYILALLFCVQANATYYGNPVGVTHGGTGTTTQAGALANVLPNQSGHTGESLTTDGTTASWAGRLIGVSTIDSGTPSLNGAADTSNLLILQSASSTFPGLVNNTTQTLSGAKTLTDSLSFVSKQTVVSQLLNDTSFIITDGTMNAAQSFTTVLGFDLAQVQLRLRRTGGPSGSMAVELRDDSAGVPGSLLATTDSKLFSSLTTSGTGALYAFTFSSPYSLSAVHKYHVVTKLITPTVDGSNTVRVHYQNTDVLADGNFSTFDGSTWTTLSTSDANFILAASETSSISNGTTGSLTLATGNISGGGNSDITLTTGTATGARGKVKLDDGSAVVGYVWAATNADGSGHWAAPAVSGANTTLSNLGTTSINANLIPAGDGAIVMGTNVNSFNSLYVQYLRHGGQVVVEVEGHALDAPDGGPAISWNSNTDISIDRNLLFGYSQPGLIKTYSPAINTNSQDLTLSTGAVSGSGVRGKIKLDDGSASSGYVWTATNTDGSGHWAIAAGGLSSGWASSNTFTSTKSGTSLPAIYGDPLVSSNYSLSMGDVPLANTTTSGGDLSVTGSTILESTSTQNGGEVDISGGMSQAGYGGEVDISGGNSIVSGGSGGGVYVSAGNVNAGAGAAGDLFLSSGGNSGSGKGGDVYLGIGGGTPIGTIKLQPNNGGDQAVIGQVWTATDVDGSGHWAAGGGSLVTADVATGTSADQIVGTGNGTAGNASSGNVNIYSGLPDGTGSTGWASLSTSNTPGSGNTGDVFIFSGNANSGNAGNINIYAGVSTSGIPGDIILGGNRVLTSIPVTGTGKLLLNGNQAPATTVTTGDINNADNFASNIGSVANIQPGMLINSTALTIDDGWEFTVAAVDYANNIVYFPYNPGMGTFTGADFTFKAQTGFFSPILLNTSIKASTGPTAMQSEFFFVGNNGMTGNNILQDSEVDPANQTPFTVGTTDTGVAATKTNSMIITTGQQQNRTASTATGDMWITTGINQGSGASGDIHINPGFNYGSNVNGSLLLGTSGGATKIAGSPLSLQSVTSVAKLIGDPGYGSATFIEFGNHLKTTQATAPTTATSGNAGTGASSSVSLATDTAGSLSLTLGSISSGGAGDQVTVSYHVAYQTGHIPIVILVPTNANAATLGPVLGIFPSQSDKDGFKVTFTTDGTIAHNGANFTWNYFVIDTQ